MIFKIADGRTCFYQWDIDRQIIVDDPTIKEVHFCNRTDVCSLVVEVVDGIANVPNKVLQSGFDVRVFGYDGKATMHEATFAVKARTQPTDYVYTEVEIKRYSDLEKRIEEMETATDEAIGEAVNNYLDEHPITMDGYATEEYVNEAVSNVKPDLTGLATEAYVDEAIKNVDVDLTDYAKKTDIPDVSNFISEIPSEYITESELEAKGYAKASALNDKADANHTHTGYAKTNHTHSAADVDGLQKALNDKATQADIDKAIELHDHRYDYAPIEHSHGDEYAAKTHTHSYNNLLDKPTIPSVEGLASEAYVNAAIKNIKFPETDLTGYATEDYVDEAIAQAQLSGEDVDLSNYATKEDLNGKADKVHSHTEYAKKSELFSKDYNDLTNKPTIPSIAGLATEDYVDNAIANIEIPESGSCDAYVLNFPETYNTIITDERTIEFLDRCWEGQLCPATYKTYFINRFTKNEFSSNTISLYYVVITNYTKGLIEYKINCSKMTNGWNFLTNPQWGTVTFVTKTSQLTNDSNFTTKAYVDSLFEGIATAEGGAY